MTIRVDKVPVYCKRVDCPNAMGFEAIVIPATDEPAHYERDYCPECGGDFTETLTDVPALHPALEPEEQADRMIRTLVGLLSYEHARAEVATILRVPEDEVLEHRDEVIAVVRRLQASITSGDSA